MLIVEIVLKTYLIIGLLLSVASITLYPGFKKFAYVLIVTFLWLPILLIFIYFLKKSTQ